MHTFVNTYTYFSINKLKTYALEYTLEDIFKNSVKAYIAIIGFRRKKVIFFGRGGNNEKQHKRLKINLICVFKRIM